jgi:hypothetical protein
MSRTPIGSQYRGESWGKMTKLSKHREEKTESETEIQRGKEAEWIGGVVQVVRGPAFQS